MEILKVLTPIKTYKAKPFNSSSSFSSDYYKKPVIKDTVPLNTKNLI